MGGSEHIREDEEASEHIREDGGRERVSCCLSAFVCWEYLTQEVDLALSASLEHLH